MPAVPSRRLQPIWNTVWLNEVVTFGAATLNDSYSIPLVRILASRPPQAAVWATLFFDFECHFPHGSLLFQEKLPRCNHEVFIQQLKANSVNLSCCTQLAAMVILPKKLGAEPWLVAGGTQLWRGKHKTSAHGIKMYQVTVQSSSEKNASPH